MAHSSATESGPLTGPSQVIFAWLQEATRGQSRHWLAWLNLLWGVLFGLPWLAPVLMRMNATGLAKGIYLAYRYLCHQLADRSFFLFGSKWMYAHTELLPYTATADTYPGLMAFVGTPELGYKVAWSDRMVSLYGGILLGGLLFATLRQRFGRHKWPYLLLLVPMVVDGGTHVISDWAGVGLGFRYANSWLARLSGNAFASSFYAGNGLGSFNSWARLVTGLLAGLAVTWFLYPLLDGELREAHQTWSARPGRAE